MVNEVKRSDGREKQKEERGNGAAGSSGLGGERRLSPPRRWAR